MAQEGRFICPSLIAFQYTGGSRSRAAAGRLRSPCPDDSSVLFAMPPPKKISGNFVRLPEISCSHVVFYFTVLLTGSGSEALGKRYHAPICWMKSILPCGFSQQLFRAAVSSFWNTSARSFAMACVLLLFHFVTLIC